MRIDVSFPHHPQARVVSKECKSIIKKLLHKDETKRLGSRAGASDVKSQPWFECIRWALLRNMNPPIIPTPPNFRESSRRAKEGASFDLETVRMMGRGMNSKSNPFRDFSSGACLHCLIITIVVTLLHVGDEGDELELAMDQKSSEDDDSSGFEKLSQYPVSIDGALGLDRPSFVSNVSSLNVSNGVPRPDSDVE